VSTADVCLVEVPYTIGDDRHGASRGASRLLEAGAAAQSVERALRRAPFRDSVSASADVNSELAAIVRRATGAGSVPLVLAGSCDACLGIIAGFDHSRCGVVWFDAHGDFNTPDSTESGFFPGMSLAVVTGHCYRKLWARIGDSTPIRESATLMIGVRDLSPDAERERLERSEIRVVEWLDGKPRRNVGEAIRELAQRVHEVYVHVDLDVLDPEIAPGIVDEPVPGGLSLDQLEEALDAVIGSFRVRAAAVTTYNPDLDAGGRTLRAALRVIELLGSQSHAASGAASAASP
jgi:arginase